MEKTETSTNSLNQFPNNKWYIFITLIIFSIIGTGFAYGVRNSELYNNLLGRVIFWHRNAYLSATIILCLYPFIWNRKKLSLQVLLFSYCILSLVSFLVYWTGSFEDLPSWRSDYIICSIFGFLLMGFFPICAWLIFYFKNKYSKIGFWLSVAFVASKIVVLILALLHTVWNGLFSFSTI